MDNKKTLLLVEGINDKKVIHGICSKHNIEPNFEIKDTGSISILKVEFGLTLKSTQLYKKVWLIIDADTNYDDAWRSIRHILVENGGYSNSIKPNTPKPNHEIIVLPDDANLITVGIWIMPNNTDVGMLEDFLISLVDKNNTLYTKAVDIVNEIESERAQHIGVYKGVHKSKATIHTWLAWQDQPGASLSLAVTKKLFDTNKELCKRFAEWLKALNN